MNEDEYDPIDCPRPTAGAIIILGSILSYILIIFFLIWWLS